MSSAWANVPFETDILCEGCGYALNGLSAGTNCPECGKPVAESAPNLRKAPSWEADGGQSPGMTGFLKTTWDIIRSPSRFYRTFATRRSRQSSLWFGRIHCGLAAVLFGVAAYLHLGWYLALANSRHRLNSLVLMLLIAGAYMFLAGTIAAAARLTHWEASYRGYRLPLQVVRRGLDYHAAHYLPVALLAAITVIGHEWLLRRGTISSLSDPAYLYILSGEVLIAAYYLFSTYWSAMRNMMYANA